jgi:uncharacterized protein (DUF2249 family)
MQAVDNLKEGQELLLIAPFKPTPLFGLLEQQGFSHKAKPTPKGDWEVRFFRPDLQPPSSTPIVKNSSVAKTTHARASVIKLDARGLEPPEPLVKILEALATLPEGAVLEAHTDRRPMHLYTQLEQRGFVAETEELSDGGFLTHVRRN